MRSPDRAVSMAFTTEESWFDSRLGQEIYFFVSSRVFRSALGLTHPYSVATGDRADWA